MNKPYLVLYGPVDTSSGYGARSRDLAKALIDSNLYDIEIMSCRWGQTPSGYLKEDNPDHKKIIDRIRREQNLTRKPDIWIMNTIPNEMQRVGQWNLLITAGIETNVCDVSWTEGCNRADLVLASSNHSKSVFEQTTFEKVDDKGNVVQTVKLQSKVEVLFEGVDNKIFKKLSESRDSDINKALDTFDEDFCFIFTGHWLQGELGQDRKDVSGLVKTFLETFKDRRIKPALILKTSGGNYSLIDRQEVLDKINRIKKIVSDEENQPKIYLLHGDLDEDELNDLYNHPKVKAMVSFTKGEGFGRPLLEFSVVGKPVITTNYSGHLDFLNKEFNTFLPGEMTKIDKSAVVQNMLLPDSSWFTVKYNEAGKIMDNTIKNYASLLGKAKRQSYLSRTNFSLEKMGESLINYIENNRIKLIDLKLPKLPKMTKIS